MRTLVIGCNHRSAGIETRERIAFDESAVLRALQLFRETFPATECVLLSTCNRMEIYAARPLQYSSQHLPHHSLQNSSHRSPRLTELVAFIARCHDVDPALFASSLYHHEGSAAVRHLFRVSSSLDSMVIGETQILGQVKSALALARQAGTVDQHLDNVFQRAIHVAKRVQTTGITAGRLSVGSTAVDLARQIFSRFDDKTVMMVGAGKMGKLALVHLLETKPGRIYVTNRTAARATALANKIRRQHSAVAEVVPYEQWIDRLAEVDILISSTGASEPILSAEQFAPIPKRRRYRPMLLIDIAVPRDIDAAIGQDDSVFLYNIDDLQSVTEQTLTQRRQAVAQAQEIVEAAVMAYVQSQDREDVGPLVAMLRQRFEQVSQQEFDRLLPKLITPSPRDRELIQQMLHRITQKLLHDPIYHLNNVTDTNMGQLHADSLRTLFNLHEAKLPPVAPIDISEKSVLDYTLK
ncbi:MAG: glutamyl-tRNA reductase [Phycisphaerae bacterium]|nr:glutamyl-tRNA reductase [Phycisphaerae bacterium]